MLIYFGADHRGFELKQKLVDVLRNQGYETADFGAKTYEKGDDYAQYAALVGKKVSLESERSRGVLICGSGAGVDIVANKFPNVRSVLGLSPDQVYAARKDDDVNVLSIAADFTNEESAKKMLEIFMATVFSGEERYKRRLDEISEIERKNSD